MTTAEAKLREQYVNVIRGWMGLKRSDQSHKVIIDAYNKISPLPRGGVRMDYSAPWCAATVSAAASIVGLTDIIPPECSCSAMIQLLQKIGVWWENDAYVPSPGDLLFFRDTEGMGAAVKESTGQYTHVALVESVGDTVWIIDATPAQGVSRRPYILSNRDKQSVPDIFRPYAATYDMDSVLTRARSYIGQPYDKAFLPDNGALYCSELIYECFLEDYSYESGTDRHLFKAGPMNWRDANGNLPKYWVKHFKKLKMAVPEGVMGTNPTDLSRSPLLRRL